MTDDNDMLKKIASTVETEKTILGAGSPTEFLLFGRMGLVPRIIIAALFFIGGGAFSIFNRREALLGVLLVLIGWIPLLLKTISNAPEDEGREDWRPVKLEDLEKIGRNLKETGEIRKKRSGRYVTGFVFVAAICAGIYAAGEGELAYFLLALAYILPAVYLGNNIKAYSPEGMTVKFPCFEWFLSAEIPANIIITPFFRFDQDRRGGSVPEDIRLLITAKTQPGDFVGIQVQCAVNKGPNGPVPYLYAVFLSRGQDGESKMRSLGFSRHGYITEDSGASGGYGAVVFRQVTAQAGYETNRDDCRELARKCWEMMAEITK